MLPAGSCQACGISAWAKAFDQSASQHVLLRSTPRSCQTCWRRHPIHCCCSCRREYMHQQVLECFYVCAKQPVQRLLSFVTFNPSGAIAFGAGMGWAQV